MPRARVLCLGSDTDAADELGWFGVTADDCGLFRGRSVRLDNIPSPEAGAIREVYAASGAFAVAASAPDGGASLLVHASDVRHRQALAEAERIGDAARETANAIRAALDGFDHGPTLPDPHELPDARLAALFDVIGKRTLIMGILNVTPDSFSDGGQFLDRGAAAARALEMAAEGADIIDVGGESTRPGADPVSAGEEIRRVIPVIREIAEAVDAVVSIDTRKARVAEAALEAGASIVNDISGASFDPEMPALIAERRCPAVLMHIKGAPRDMQVNPSYDDLMGEVYSFLSGRIAELRSAGADERMLLVDPGIGFGKTVEHNLRLMRRLAELKSLGRPIVVGTSRKSTIGKVLGDLPAGERLEGTAATVAVCIVNGASVVRVHDVKQMARVARMTDAIVRGRLEV